VIAEKPGRRSGPRQRSIAGDQADLPGFNQQGAAALLPGRPPHAWRYTSVLPEPSDTPEQQFGIVLLRRESGEGLGLGQFSGEGAPGPSHAGLGQRAGPVVVLLGKAVGSA